MNSSTQSWTSWGVDRDDHRRLETIIAGAEPPVERWQQALSVLTARHAFEAHRFVYEAIYGRDVLQHHPQPAWFPDDATVARANVTRWCQRLQLEDARALHAWSIADRDRFWLEVVRDNGIEFADPFDRVRDMQSPITAPRWFPGAKMNIARSCFANAESSAPAIEYEDESGQVIEWSYGELEENVQRVAGALQQDGFRPGDAAAILMPMTPEAVAIYLGIIWAGGAAIGIADSFAPPAIAQRLRLGNARLVFTSADYERGGKTIELYDRLLRTDAPTIIVVGDQALKRRSDHLFWPWIAGASPMDTPVPCDPMATTNILFSSGTTGDPKAIPWNHTTPLKCVSDARFHHDIHAGDLVAWPTNLGWMMGPWLIYASFVPGARLALFGGNPGSDAFASFVQRRRVTMLGVIPSLVRNWRQHRIIERRDWSSIRCFSSTGECSQPEDMLYLMSRAGYRPMIEYCGGTEIGGGYISSTVVEPSAPSVFTMPTMGLDFRILDEDGRPEKAGQVYLVPPSVGLSVTLLNRDHDAEYFAGVPADDDGTPLRRHGDALERLDAGHYRVLGRADDTMNLGGIKVSSAEIERAIGELDPFREVAAVSAPPPGGGPERLFIFAVVDSKADVEDLASQVRQTLRERLNPLFKLEELITVEQLPRTASNKVMRRVLRQRLIDRSAGPS